MKCLSERMVLSLVLCLGTINMLAQRVNLSIAILCMTNHSSINENDSVNDKHTMNDNSTSSICSIQSLNKTETMMDGPFVWDRSSRGILLGIIFWGYFLGQIPAGILIQKFSVRLVLLISLILMSTSTILVPLVATKFLYLFYAVRVLTGLTSASWFPGFYQLWAAWAPPNERGLLIGFAYAGLHIGSAISMPITGALCQTSLGWSLVFYFYGAFSFLYCIIWFIFVYDEPKTHPRISLKEKIYLESSCPIIKNDKKGKIPFKSILTSLPVWAFVFVNIGIDWNLYTFLTSVPTYMREVLHFDFQRNALLSSIPYIGMWIGQILFGWLSDIF
ncbi:inorganic phosphate cotransporter [Schistosoma japonicum]|nr:inorganic phosphate cotransporter [Schistosoma japonicum]KAH8862314.1 inorganic phosphate cotransporter [Schistosoma japonicum]